MISCPGFYTPQSEGRFYTPQSEGGVLDNTLIIQKVDTRINEKADIMYTTRSEGGDIGYYTPQSDRQYTPI